MNITEWEAEESHFKRYLFVYASLIIFVVWASTPFVMKWLVSEFYPTLGQAGDMFGSINALFSGITIAGLLITIVRQQDEMKRADRQFHEQKHQAEVHLQAQLNQAETIHQEQKKQIQENFDKEKALLKKQISRDNLQRFETSFFRMLDLHADVVERITKGVFVRISKLIDNISHIENLDHLTREYKDIEVFINDNLSEYFATIDMIVAFIYRRKKGINVRDRYLNIYLTQFSLYERKTLLYFYNLSKKPDHWDDIKSKLFNNFTVGQISNKHKQHLEPFNAILDSIK